MEPALNVPEIQLSMPKLTLADAPQDTPTKEGSVWWDVESMKCSRMANAAALLDTTLSMASVDNVIGTRFTMKVSAFAEFLVMLSVSTILLVKAVSVFPNTTS
jgi:hypothetical protein